MISTSEAPSIQKMKICTFGVVGERAAGDEPQHAEAEIDADLHQARRPTGRPRTAIANCSPSSSGSARVSGSSTSKKRVRQRAAASGCGGIRSTVMRKRSAAIARSRSIVGAARQRAIEIDHRADVARDRGGQPVGDDVEMALHEHIGDRRLQQHHRQDHDQQRARVEALGQQIGERPRAAAPERARRRRRAASLRAKSIGGHGSTTSL